MVNIEGLNKADVLRALYDNAKTQGLGFLHYDSAQMSTEEAERLLGAGTYFDYVKGRVMKVDLSSDVEFEEWLYDRDNGQGAAQRVIDGLRNR